MIAGHVRPEPEVEALVAELGGNLRAVLRDVLCGHLDPDLRRVADEMLERRPRLSVASRQLRTDGETYQ